jgi:ATP-binding cassette subfamily C protein
MTARPFGRMVRSPSRSRRALALIRGTLQNRHRELWVLLFWSAVEAIPAFLSGRIVQLAVDQGFLQHRLLVGFGWLVLLAASFIAGGIAAGKVFRGLGAVIEPMRDDLARMVVEGSIRRASRLGLPVDRTAVARLTEQVEITREATASVLMVTQGFIVAAVGAVAGLLSLIPAALILVLPPALLGLGIFIAALPRMADRQLEAILADERAADSVAAVAAGMRDVVACGGEEPAARLVERHIDAQADASRRLARLTALRTLAVAAGGLLPVILIIALGSWLRSNGATTGALLGALTYVLSGVQPALQQLVRNLGSSGVWLVSAVTRIVDASGHAAEDERRKALAHTPDPRVIDPEPLPRFRSLYWPALINNVTFAYSASAAPVIRGLDLAVGTGDHLAIIGPSGAGKSTLSALMAGLLEPQAGSVRIGGIDATTARRRGSALRALIPQEAYVFSGTLLDNFSYLNRDVSREAVERAIDVLGASSLVERLGGCDAAIDPSVLSAGERQLITLVRAYVSPAPLIVLDEATCHLDPDAEARAERAFTERPGALVVIAHRMSSAERAQRVLLLDGGDAMIGTHDELLNRSDLYRTLAGYWAGREPGAAPPRETSDRIPLADHRKTRVKQLAQQIRSHLMPADQGAAR